MKTYTWYVCDKCCMIIVLHCQDHERVIVKNPAYADGECQVCYGVIHFKVIVQQNTEKWLHMFAFNKEYNERVKPLTTIQVSY